MNTNTVKSIRWWALALCCVLLNTARAQDTGQAVTGNDAAVQAPDQPAPGQKHGDDDWSDSPDTGPIQLHHHHRHHGNKDAVVSIGRNAELSAGQHADSVVAIFGSATSAGDVDDAVVSVLGNTRVTGKVGDATVAVMGSVYVNGEVGGDVVAVLGNVELGPEARVRGDIVVVGGKLTRDPAATVGGSVQTVFTTDWTHFEWLRPWVDRCLLYGRPLAFAHGLGWAWSIALGMLALYLFIAFLFHGAVERCVHTLESQPGQSVLAALLTVLLTPVVLVLLLITVLGIAAIPFLAMALLCAAAFGKIVVLASIGRRCTPMLANDPVIHTLVGVLVGAAIVLVLYTIPVVGFIVYKLLGILGLGVVMYTLLIALRSGRQARAEARGGSPGPSGGSARNGGPGVWGGQPTGLGAAGGEGSARGAVGGEGSSAASAVGGEAASAAGTAGAGGGETAWAGTVDGGSSSAASAGTGGGEGSSAKAESATGQGPTAGKPEFGDFTAPPGAPPGGGFASSPGPSSPHPTAPMTSLPRAGFLIRMGALLLDAVLVGILLHQVHRGTNLGLLVLATYGAVMWKLKGSTVGGIICGLQVVRLDGRPIDWPTAIVRALSCFLSFAVVGLGFLWIAIDAEKQSWHDKIAGTVVVRAPKGASLL